MSTLHIHNFPEELYERIQKLAASNNHPIQDEVILLLNRAVGGELERDQQARLLEKIKQRRFTPPIGAADSLQQLRDDRSR